MEPRCIRNSGKRSSLADFDDSLVAVDGEISIGTQILAATVDRRRISQPGSEPGKEKMAGSSEEQM